MREAPLATVNARLQGELDREIAARLRAESALRQETDRAQRYLDAADVILLALDLEGRITLINRKGVEILGCTERELIGRDWVEACLPPRLHDALRASFRGLVGGDLTIVENPVLTRSGAERLIEWHNMALRDEQGRVVGTFSSGTDITGRRQAEEAERASERRYRALFEYAPNGILIADSESRYLDANPSICRMLGYARDELVGLSASDIVSAAEVEHIAPALYAIKFSSDYHREWQFRRKDGSVFTADVIAAPMPDGNLMGVINDVTERNRVVAALRETEERMRFALDSANVGIWDIDYAIGLLRWSAACEAHYGVPAGTFAGSFEAFIERIHPDDRASSLATISNAMNAGSDFAIQHRTIHPDGTVHWLRGAGRILLDEHGAPVRGVGITQDVTELHHLNDEILRQRLQVFKATIRTVQDIVNNMLGSFQLVRLDAGPHLSEDSLALIDRMVAEASLKLRMLGDLDTVSEKAMAIGEGIDYPGAGW